MGRARRGPDIGLGNITIVQDLIETGGYFGEEVPESLSIIKCHRDEVLEPPESAKVIGFSGKCDVEIFSVEDHLLCFQGHPEYNKEILLEIIDRVNKIRFIEVCLNVYLLGFNPIYVVKSLKLPCQFWTSDE